MSLTKSQLAIAIGHLPKYVAPTFAAVPYVATETLAGDTVDLSSGAINAGYPLGTASTPHVLVNGIDKGTSYTTVPSDVGKTLVASQSATNAMGTVSANSAGVTVGAAQTFAGLNLLGANVEDSAEYGQNQLFNNAVFDSRGFGAAGSNTAGGVALDVNGWPAAAWRNVISAYPGTGGGGQLLPGTYQCRYRSAGQAVNIDTSGSSGGVVVSNFAALGDGVTKTFTLTVPSGAVNVMLNGDGAVQYLDIPRDGTTPSETGSLFNSAAIAFYAKFALLRFMDFLETNSNTQVNWSDRPVDYPACPHKPWSWPLWIQFVNAIAAYPGSKLKKVWLNTSGLITTAYATSLATLLNTYPLSSALTVFVEAGNEPWNPSFNQYHMNMNSAEAEAQVVANYGLSIPSITSVVGDGMKVTVTLSTPLPSFITTGAPCVVYNVTDSTWSAGSLASPVTATVTGASTFTYPSTSSGTMTGTKKHGVFFGLSSTLVADNTSLSVFDLTHKWHVRQTHLLQQAWAAVRPQDRFIVNVQQYGGLTQGGALFPPVQIPYGQYIGGGSLSWLYGIAIAPYIKTIGSNADANACFTTLNSNLAGTITLNMQSHIFQCKLAGVHPLCYEGGPDTQATPTLNTAIHYDARMGTLVSSLLDTWFKMGGEEINLFTLGPSAILNSAQGGWPFADNFSDTASPKIAALLGYSTGKTYTNLYGSPGTLLVATYQDAVSNGTVQGTNGMFYWFSNAADRQLGMACCFPRTRRMAMTIWGSDTTAGTTVSAYLDGVLVGSTTLPGNGDASQSATVAGAAAPIVYEFPSGGHSLRLRCAAGLGTKPGILKVAFAAA